MALKADHPYPDVRALERGLKLIDAFGEHGWLGPTELARHTGIDRSTIYRLLSTLERSGFVVRHPQHPKYFLSSKFHGLGVSIQARDQLVVIASDPLNELVSKINWPSDFGVLEGGRLLIAGSNHPMTTMTFYRSLIGHTRRVMGSALGRAILSAMSEDQRATALESIKLLGGQDAADVSDEDAVGQMIEATNRRGYALSVGEAVPNVAAIALPVVTKLGVAGAVNIVFFRSTFRIEWAERYLEPLRLCVERIENKFNELG